MAPAYGGKGPLVLGVTWAEAGLALLLISLRAKNASVAPEGKMSVGMFGSVKPQVFFAHPRKLSADADREWRR